MSSSGNSSNNGLIGHWSKCPVSMKYMTLMKGIERKKITFMHLQNGVPKLKGSEKYMY